MKPLAYLVGGALMGFGAAYLALEDRFGKKYAEMANANQRAYEKAAGLKFVEGVHAANEDALKVIGNDEDGVVAEDPDQLVIDLPFSGETKIEPGAFIQKADLNVENPYHTAVEKTLIEEPLTEIVAAPVSDYGISYIEEEEFEEEDGNAKYHVDLIMDDTNPIFLMDGIPLDDWSSRLGDSILVDMFQRCPPGSAAILYVRNHRADEDYEVIRVEP